MTSQQEPCLSCQSDEAFRSVLEFSGGNRYTSSDWNSIRETRPLLEQLSLYEFNCLYEEDQPILLEITFAVKLHPNISKIFLHACSILDITALCLAVSDKGGGKLMSLEFEECDLDFSPMRTLEFLLESNRIEELLFKRCHFPDEMDEQLADGLHYNKSLKKLKFRQCAVSERLLSSAFDMLAKNTNLVEFCTCNLDRADQYWRLFSSLQEQNHLQRLQIFHSQINLPSMRAIMMMCLSVESIRHLELSYCTIEPDALDFMNLTLSRNYNVLDELVLGRLNCRLPSKENLHVNIHLFANAKVKTFDLRGTKLDRDTFTQICHHIADNPAIQHLDLRHLVLDDDLTVEIVCNTFLLPNIGPQELVIDEVNENYPVLLNGLRENTNLRNLTILTFERGSTLGFVRGLANIGGLRKIVFGWGCAFSDKVMQALGESLEQNTSLWTVTMMDVFRTPIISNYHKKFPRIRYLLALNRVGRHLLLRERVVPGGLWPLVLERSSNEIDGIYFILTNKPDILNSSSSRKRKANDDE